VKAYSLFGKRRVMENCFSFVKQGIILFDLRIVYSDTKFMNYHANHIPKNYINAIVYNTDLPKRIELGDAVDDNPYHLYFYMISRFYFFDHGDTIIPYYYVSIRKSYFAEAALAALPQRFQRETIKRPGYEYVEMPGCNWYPDAIDEPWMPSYVSNLYKHIWEGFHQEKGKFSFISRKQGKKKARRIVNEAELYEPLKKLGFSIYHLEDLTFEQQVRLFATSQIITGGHGAGLAHIIFCKANTLICEINHGQTPAKNHYVNLALQCGLRHYMYNGASPIPDGETDGTEDLLVDVTRYVAALAHIKTLC
jgi:hypothetical protein